MGVYLGRLDELRDKIRDSSYSTEQLVDFAVKYAWEYLSARDMTDAKAFLETYSPDDRRMKAAHTLVSAGITLDRLHQDTPE